MMIRRTLIGLLNSLNFRLRTAKEFVLSTQTSRKLEYTNMTVSKGQWLGFSLAITSFSPGKALPLVNTTTTFSLSSFSISLAALKISGIPVQNMSLLKTQLDE